MRLWVAKAGTQIQTLHNEQSSLASSMTSTDKRLRYFGAADSSIYDPVGSNTPATSMCWSPGRTAVPRRAHLHRVCLAVGLVDAQPKVCMWRNHMTWV